MSILKLFVDRFVGFVKREVIITSFRNDFRFIDDNSYREQEGQDGPGSLT